MDSHEDLRNPLRRRLGGPQTAEDVLHEAVARALERANQLRESESVRRWFGRIVANALADHFRRTPKRRRGMRRQAQYLIADAIVDDELDATACACLDKRLGTSVRVRLLRARQALCKRLLERSAIGRVACEKAVVAEKAVVSS
jgi:DNA-directed RNA polymerase specialized sigma24 family protein